jgi:hypothetical protein
MPHRATHTAREATEAALVRALVDFPDTCRAAVYAPLIRSVEQDGGEAAPDADSAADMQKRTECPSLRGTRQVRLHARGVGWNGRVTRE